MDMDKIMVGLGLRNPPPPISFHVEGRTIYYNFGYSSNIGELVVEIYNSMKDKERLKLLVNDLVLETQKASVKGDSAILIAALDVAEKYVSPVFSRVIMYLLFSCFDKKEFYSHLIHMLQMFEEMCGMYIYAKESRLVPASPKGLELNALITVNKGGAMGLEFSSSDPAAIVGFQILKMQEMGIRPSICQMCGKAFFPSARSDEIYCKNEYKNGRTCSEIAFEVKSKEDPFYSAYRSAYKTMSARASRMEGSVVGRYKLDQWRTEAKEKLAEYKAAGDIDGFKEWIAQSKK